MLDCQNLHYSLYYSEQRIALASEVIGEKNVKKFFALACYLQGASRSSIAENFAIPYDTLKSLTDRFEHVGIAALLDRRQKYQAPSKVKEKMSSETPKIQAYFQDDYLYINLEPNVNLAKIPSNKTMQIKATLLTLLDNKLLSSKTVSELLGYSAIHIQRLHQKLQNDDATLFSDQRKGQQKNYKCEPEILTEVIQQYIANLTSGRSVSSEKISEDLKERCNIDLPSRTIRHHLNKSGLSRIKKTLPDLLERLKKTSKIPNQ